MKKKRNWGFVIFMILGLFVSLFGGIAIGMEIEQILIIKGATYFLSGSNVNVTIDINETALVDRINETIVPQIKDYYGDSASMETNCIYYRSNNTVLGNFSKIEDCQAIP